MVIGIKYNSFLLVEIKIVNYKMSFAFNFAILSITKRLDQIR